MLALRNYFNCSYIIIMIIAVSMRLMYEVHCSQFFGSVESDDFRVDSPVDNLGHCRNVRIRPYIV